MAVLTVTASTRSASAHTEWSRPANAKGSSIGLAIVRRLTATHQTVAYRTSGSYDPRPQASFCTWIDYPNHVSRFFVLCVSVYTSHALAETGYGDDYSFVQQQGGLDANQFDVVGPIEFWGSTAGSGYVGYPPGPLPRSAFLKWVAIALGHTA